MLKAWFKRRAKALLVLLLILLLLLGCLPAVFAAGDTDELSTSVPTESTVEQVEVSEPDSSETDSSIPLLEITSVPEQPDTEEDSEQDVPMQPMREDTSFGIARTSLELVSYEKTLDGIFFQLSTGHSDTDYWRKWIAGTTAYCLEPGVAIGSEYEGIQVSDEAYYRMSLADYWGRYKYGDTSETNFYVQLYVWEVLGHQVTALSGPTVSLDAYNAWKAAIQPAIDAFFTPPSFAGQTVTLRKGESVTLVDSNGSLPYYSMIYDGSGLTCNPTNNGLVITTTSASSDGVLDFQYEIDFSFMNPIFYWSDGAGGQDLVTTGIADPKMFDLVIQFRQFRITATKTDAETKSAQGDASLAGAVYGIYDNSMKLLDKYTTNASGGFTTDYYYAIVGEKYYIKEISPSPGYLLDDTVYEFNCDREAMPELLNTFTRTVTEEVIRGGVWVEKWDNEIDAHAAQGGATLQGAVFNIYNRSKSPVQVDGKVYAVGEIVSTITTDENGVAQTASDTLPYGTYEVKEYAPPTGYLPTGVLSRTFSITQNGVIVKLDTSGTAIKNNPIRGDLRGVKVSDGDMKRLAGVPFRITSATTGESHVVVTDENGQFDTASSWNPHSQNTNRGETADDGIWFGDISTLDNSLGALIFDTYVIEELPCAANMLYDLLPPFEVKVYRHNVTVDLGTITNDYAVPPQIGTTATDSETGTHEAYISRETTIIDVVEYIGLKPGVEYTLTGTLMRKDTGKPVVSGGDIVTSSVTFTPDEPDGTVEVPFTFNSSDLGGASVVVFESLYVGDTELATHADIEDEGQTVTFVKPKIRTTAKDSVSGNNTAKPNEKTTIVDTVKYTGLTPGTEYILTGTLMDKSAGKPLLVDGQEVVSSIAFTPEKRNGTVDISFTFNSSALAGKSVVVFESLYIGEIEVATHADINDVGQTVTFETPPAAERPAVPQTGDGGLVLEMLAAAAALVAVIVLVAVSRYKARKKQNNYKKDK